MTSKLPRVQWPDGKHFAFTVCDDTDLATLDNVSEVYALLSDLGFRTTKTCWPLRGDESRGANAGQTCEDQDYCRWLLGLQAKGFEIGWHGATWHSSLREETLRGLDRFAAVFGNDPRVAANHTGVADGIYWAEKRVTGIHVAYFTISSAGCATAASTAATLKAIRITGATPAASGSSIFAISSFRRPTPSMSAR